MIVFVVSLENSNRNSYKIHIIMQHIHIVHGFLSKN